MYKLFIYTKGKGGFGQAYEFTKITSVQDSDGKVVQKKEAPIAGKIIFKLKHQLLTIHTILFI